MNMTQGQLAEHLHCSTPFVSMIENGHRVIGLHELIAACDVLDFDIGLERAEK